jgi:hypothetical protein
MITIDSLIAAGYSAHKQDEPMANDTFYQKVIVANDVKLYFLNFTIWFFSKHLRAHALGDRVSCESRLYLPAANTLVGSTGFTLALSLELTATIAGAEMFYAGAYERFHCVPDLLNN